MVKYLRQFVVFERGCLLFSADGADAFPAVTIKVVLPVDAARVEAQGVCVGRDVCAERTRPVVAVSSIEVELHVVVFAGSGQEDGIAISLAHNQLAVHAVLRRPYRSRVFAIEHFLELCQAWHLPVIPPIHRGRIVFRQKFCQGVCETIVASLVLITVFLLKHSFTPIL